MGTPESIIASAIEAMLTRGDADRCAYGVNVRDYCTSHQSFALELTLKGGREYCCMECGCHFGFFDAAWFELLAGQITSSKRWTEPDLPTNISAVRVTVESGVRLTATAQLIESPQTYEVGPFPKDCAPPS